ncbi:MAG: ATP-binding protein [Bdellovibrionota bacterium]
MMYGGQEQAKKALIISAVGGHNLLMIGSPGCGKSMLAKRMPSILPRLVEKEILETVKIHSIANQSIKNIILGEPPFRSPHHIILAKLGL